MVAHNMLKEIEDGRRVDTGQFGFQVKANLPPWMGFIKDPEEQLFRAARMAFVASILRAESGAAVTPAEREEYGAMYFPEKNDGPEVKELKRQWRVLAISGNIRAAGQAWIAPEDVKILGEIPAFRIGEKKTIDGVRWKRDSKGWKRDTKDSEEVK